MFFRAPPSILHGVSSIPTHLCQAMSGSLNAGQLRLVRSLRLARALRSMRILRLFRYVGALRTSPGCPLSFAPGLWSCPSLETGLKVCQGVHLKPILELSRHFESLGEPVPYAKVPWALSCGPWPC